MSDGYSSGLGHAAGAPCGGGSGRQGVPLAGRISLEELEALFGDSVPVRAVALLQDERLTPGAVRWHLQVLAKAEAQARWDAMSEEERGAEIDRWCESWSRGEVTFELRPVLFSLDGSDVTPLYPSANGFLSVELAGDTAERPRWPDMEKVVADFGEAIEGVVRVVRDVEVLRARFWRGFRFGVVAALAVAVPLAWWFGRAAA